MEAAGERPPVVELGGVSKRFGTAQSGGATYAIKDVSLTQGQGELCCLLGPSGCGKTTILNMIAGFVQPSSGSLLVDGEVRVKPGPDRAIVFQDYALLPWLTVRANIELGLKLQRMPKQERRRIVDEHVELVELVGSEDKYPHQLSGGMQQRVAIARALALKPVILLMDEPFGALDAQTRLGMQEELERLWQETRKTILLVSHSVDEAIYLADRVLVMGGRPGSILRDIEISLQRPRDRTSPEFNEIKREVFGLLTDPSRRRARRSG